MKLISSFFILVILCTSLLYAQSNVQQAWVNHYDYRTDQGHEMVVAIALDSSGNVYVAGNSEGDDTMLDYTVTKYNKAGSTLWTARFNGPQNKDDIVTGITVDNDGNVYVTGETIVAGYKSDYATVKFKDSGEQEWVAYYDGPGNSKDMSMAISIDSWGNVYVTGFSMGAGWFSNSDYATIKYNSAGEQQWVARYDGPAHLFDTPMDIDVDSNGNIYVTGASYGSGSMWGFDKSNDFATIKYDSEGEQIWVARYNSSTKGNDLAVAMDIDNDDNVYVTGISSGLTMKSDIITIKYNIDGDEQWIARFNSPENMQDNVADIAVDDIGNIFVTGTVNAELFNPNSDIITIKYDNSGKEEWSSRYDGPANLWDTANALSIDTHGNVYVTGQSNSTNENSDFVTMKYNSIGTKMWDIRYSSVDSSDDGSRDVVVDKEGNVFIAGTSEMDNNGGKQTTIKYVQQGSAFPPIKKLKLLEQSILFKHGGNYPNPFNAVTNIRYEIFSTSYVNINIFNSLGQEVAVLIDQELSSGVYNTKWDASQMKSGVYFCQLRVGNILQTKKLLLIK